jgi:hypothetical protein
MLSAHAEVLETPIVPVSMDAHIQLRYQNKTAIDADDTVYSDNDINEELYLRFSLPGLAEFSFLGAAYSDLDNNSDNRSFSPVEDSHDTGIYMYFRPELYYAYFTVYKLMPFIPYVKAGRQISSRNTFFTFDGLSAGFTIVKGLSAYIYGGLSVHHSEVNYEWGSDYAAGAAVDYSPLSLVTISADYMYSYDKRVFPVTNTFQNHTLSGTVRILPFPFLRSMIRFRFYDFKPDALTVRILSVFSKIDLEIALKYYLQLAVSDERTTDIFSLYNITGVLHPYQYVDLKVRKQILPWLSADIGAYLRFLLDDGNASVFNHSYQKFFVGVQAALLNESLMPSISGEMWRADDRNIISAGLDITYKNKTLNNSSASAGMYYSLYKYSYFDQYGELENVTTIYGKIKAKIIKGLSADFGYEFEMGYEKYHNIKAGIRYDI